MTRKYHLLTLPLHIASLSSQGSSLCEVPTKKSVSDFRVYHAVHCLAYFDTNFVGERFKNKQKMKAFPSIQCEFRVCEVRVPLRATCI